MTKVGLSFLLMFMSWEAAAQQSISATLKNTDKIAEVAANAPEGTTFYLEPGEYRYQAVQPKNGQKFIGKGKVVFNGSMPLTEWRQVDNFWVAAGPPERRHVSGACREAFPLCGHREDLFVDGVVYRKVASLEEVGARKWFDDGVNVYVSEDPTDQKVELSVMPYAFGGDANDVHIENITVEKYASAAQRGAIEFLKGTGWQLKNVIAQWNHGVGARIGPETKISGGSYSHNGQLGLGGGFGKGIVIENVEIAYNNYAGFSAGWEAGGTKFVKADGMVVRNSCVHHNDGPGLWTDIDNINIVFADNLVFNNLGDGIKHEISYSAKIYGNTVARNGYEEANWLWGSQILIQNSQNVEVYDNVVELGPKYGNGISVINQERGEGAHGPWLAMNNRVHNNKIIHLAGRGLNGVIADYKREWFDKEANNVFESNTYIVPDIGRPYLVFEDDGKRFDELPPVGMETKAKVEIAKREPMELKCP
jgi:hypothetical protein